MGERVKTPPKVNSEFQTFLSKFHVAKGMPFGFITKEDPKDRYFIPSEYDDEFMTKYQDAIVKGEKHCLGEMPSSTRCAPLRVDFDLQASLSTGCVRQYTPTLVDKIIKIYQDIIKEITAEEDFEPKMLMCIVLEKPKPREDLEKKKIKDGIHLHWPFFICEKWLQDELIRRKANNKMLELKVWKDCNYETPIDKMIDANIGSSAWLMYGSSKTKTSYAYTYSRTVNHRGDNIKLADAFVDEMQGREKSPKYYLPYFLSIRGHSLPTSLKSDLNEIKKAYVKPKRKNKISSSKPMEEIEEELIQVKDLVEMLSDERANDYYKWMDVGWLLFNIGRGCDQALKIWEDFSRRSDNFVQGECEDKWATMELRGRTIEGLYKMAQSDSPIAFKSWKNIGLEALIRSSLLEADKPNETLVCNVIKKMYSGRFVCANSKKDIWYEYYDHRWHYADDGVPLRKIFSNELLQEYLRYRIKVVQKQSETKEEIARLSLEKEDKRCFAIITALRTCKFQALLLRMCKTEFHDYTFDTKKDANRMLLGCENGVLDLEAKIFREGRSDDFITYSTGITYRDDFTESDLEVIQIREIIRKIFLNDTLHKYFYDFVASCLEGGNLNKTFLVHTGATNGGKSIIFSLLEETFKDYCVNAGQDVIKKGKGSSAGAARPDIARFINRRFVLVSEISKNDELDIAALKLLISNDRFYARGLYSDGADIRPTFVLMLQCNDPPKIPGNDEATWNKIRLLDYNSHFVLPKDLKDYPVSSDIKTQYDMKRFNADESIKNKFPSLAPAFLWLLFNRYKENGKTVIEPDQVKTSTEDYRAKNDIYISFIKNKLEKAEYNPNDEDPAYLRLNELVAEFKNWFDEEHTAYAKEKPTTATLLHEFNKRLGPAKPPKGVAEGRSSVKGWYGWRVVVEDLAELNQKYLEKVMEEKNITTPIKKKKK